MIEEDVKNRVKQVRDFEKVYIQKSNYSKIDGDTKVAFYDWIDATMQLLSDYYPSNNEFLLSIKEMNCSDGFAMYDFYNEIRNTCSFMLYDIESDKVARQQVNHEQTQQVVVKAKPPKVFISHKYEDKKYAKALIDLIDFILGAGGEKVFCSSIPGYGIKQARPILEELKQQFDNNNVFMLIIHSPRYYQSAVCLNEMGASWVLGTKFASFMTKDCKYDDLRGVINKEKICINLNDDIDMLKAHLNDFKNDLMSFFGVNPNTITGIKWETARNHFIDEVSKLTYEQENKVAVDNKVNSDFIKTHYISAFDYVFELLDIDNFKNWGYECAISGNTALRRTIYSNLENIVSYIKSRPKHKYYPSWNSLLQNLGQLIFDFKNVFSQHAILFGDNVYTVEKFYKINPSNPNYNKDLEAYNQFVWLVSDLLFELARLCNYIISKIRSRYPEYKKELGLLILDNDMNSPDLVYRESEISDAPYPGLEAFISVRLTREIHYGNNPKIGANGYERS